MGRLSRQSIFARFAPAAEDLRRVGGLPTAVEAREVWSDIWHRDAHNSTAIEGNTLVLREVEALLEHGRAVGSKDLRDYLEVLGYGEAARWVYSQAVGRGSWEPDATPEEGPGRFRRHDIRPFDGGMTPPPWNDVPAQLRTWTDQAVELGHGVTGGAVQPPDLPMRLAELHFSFDQVHPFIDGNGRTGRLVMNLILVRLGWPPAIIFKRMRSRYLSALDRADKGDPGLLAEMIARSVLENLERLVLPGVAGPARLVPLSALAGPRITLRALREAAKRGRLEAELSSAGTWRSSGRAVDRYLENRYQRT